ncbi:Ribosomal RNA-processing protein 7 A [Rhizophlyctis rosea]|nr:Ribosomal RNA-processing protein 7 A [Rhizophlyctis rosea]
MPAEKKKKRSQPSKEGPGTTTIPLPQFNQFKLLEVTMPPLSLTPLPKTFTTHTLPTPPTPHPVTHTILMRPHEFRQTTHSTSLTSLRQPFPEKRTLFLANIPTDSSEAHFRRLFRRCGTVEWVQFHDQGFVKGRLGGRVHKVGGSAHVVFREEEAVERVMGMKVRRRVWSDAVEEGEKDGEEGERAGDAMYEDETDKDAMDEDGVPGGRKKGPEPVGMEKYLLNHFHSRPPLPTLSHQVNTSLAAFESAEEQARLAAARRHNVPDEDGFVLVTRSRGRRNVNTDASGASVTAARPEEIKKLKPKKLEVVDFYRFQMRESKRNQLADLRRKFEEDKEKIAKLKASRRFKPY